MNRLKFSYLVVLIIQFFLFPDYLTSASQIQESQTREVNQSFIYEEFELIGGVEVADINFWQEWIDGSYSRRRVIQLKEGADNGRAETVFFESSAKYDITLIYVEGKKPDSKIILSINEQQIGKVEFGSSYSFKEEIFKDVNVQKWSTIRLDFEGEDDAKCRLEKIILTRVGPFDGNIVNLTKPTTLRLFESLDDVQKGRRIFHDYVLQGVANANNKRNQELDSIKNQKATEAIGSRWQDSGIEKWKLKQESVRQNLHKHFGEFPERTPLNAKITGKLEYEKYTIEKLIFESQPGFYVTANLYVPKGREFPVPGVVFPLGHSDVGKSRDNYHMSGLGLVLKGYVVLVYDPIGQGERSEYINEDNDWLVHVGVDQHWYVGRPAFLANWTLSGLRTWDGIRAVDYLVSRPEVDGNKLAAVGCSGGGQMALLITAVDERIKVCAASHPGGPMENAYLTGKRLPDKEIYSLIPPRPLRIIVGIESLEEPRHREYLEDMQLFYEGLRAGKQTAEIDVVPGPHSMNRSNRESAYEWLNKWFDKEKEGKAEDDLKVEKEEDLWSTESGNALASLGSETGQTLNAKRARQIYNSNKDFNVLKENIAERIGLYNSGDASLLKVKTYDLNGIQDLTVEKLSFESEEDVIIPSLLIKPQKIKSDSPIYFYVSENGKPIGYQSPNLPFLLAKEGYIVFAVDVRGTGETSPTPSFSSNQFTGYTPMLRVHDDLAIQSSEFGQTTLGMRTRDIIRGIDFIKSREDLSNRRIITIGEGLGGLWTLVAAVYDERINNIVTVGTLPSYMPLLENKYYNNVWGYFWVPGALKDFDIPDLAALNASKQQLWIDPVNELGNTSLEKANRYLKQKNLKVVNSSDGSPGSITKLIVSTFK